MNKQLILLALIILPWIAVAQQKEAFEYESNPSKSIMTPTNDWSSYNVLFQETFDSARWYPSHNNDQIYPENMPDRWSVVDNTNNDFFWGWSQDFPRFPMFFAEYPTLQSASDRTNNQKGVMMLESSYYNTDNTGATVDPPVEMDSYIQFGPFEATESESVILYFEQYHRFCCGTYNETAGAFLEISNNGTDWTSIPVHQSAINARPKSNPSIQYINISNIAANSETVYFRFHQIGQSHYYWIIDDIYVFEPYEHDTRLLQYWTDYSDLSEASIPYNDYRYSGIPFHSPYFCFQELYSTRAKIINCGKDPITNARLKSTITHNGNEIYNQTSSYITSLESCAEDTLKITNAFQIPQEQSSIGNYTLQGVVETEESDATEENNIDLYNFNITSELHGYANPKKTNGLIMPFRSFAVFYKNTGVGIINYLNPLSKNKENDSITILGANIYIPDTKQNNSAWQQDNPQFFNLEFHQGILQDTTWIGDISAPLFSRDSVAITPAHIGKWVYIPFSKNSELHNIPTPTENTPFLTAIRYCVNSPIFIGADTESQPSLFSGIYIFSGISFPCNSNAAIQLVTRQDNMEPIISSITFKINNNNPNSGEWHPGAGAVVTIFSNDAQLNPTATNYTANGSGEVTIGFDRNGSYSYKVEYLGTIAEGTVTAIGKETTEDISFALVGIDEEFDTNSVQIYPNPATSTLFVKSASKIDKVVIYNLLGKEVKALSIIEQPMHIDISFLTAGAYVINIVSGNSNTSKLFIKK